LKDAEFVFQGSRITPEIKTTFLLVIPPCGTERLQAPDFNLDVIGFQVEMPPKMLQEILGHASITTTLDLYGHLYPGDMDRYADRLDSAADLAADQAGKTKIRPDEQDQGEDGKGPSS
jgi:hypothetical protein